MNASFFIWVGRNQYAVAVRIGRSVYVARNWKALQRDARQHVQAQYDPPYPNECSCPVALARQAEFAVPARHGALN